MSRVAVCLFFIAILHNGVLKYSRADETPTDSLSKNTEETTVKPAETETAKDGEVPSKAEKSAVPSKTEEANYDPAKTADNTDKEKVATAIESKKEDVTDKINSDTTKFISVLLKNDETPKTVIEFPKTILGQVSDVGAKIGEAVSKSIDTAKDFAGGTFNFLRTSVNSAFQN